MNHVVWTQWDDIEVPDGITKLGPATAPLDSDLMETVTFYVPTYMTGRVGLEPVTRMSSLQILQMPNAGYDDALAYRREGLTICNAKGVHDISTSELALALTCGMKRHRHEGVGTHVGEPRVAESLRQHAGQHVAQMHLTVVFELMDQIAHHPACAVGRGGEFKGQLAIPAIHAAEG